MRHLTFLVVLLAATVNAAVIERSVKMGQPAVLTSLKPATWTAPNRAVVVNSTTFTVTYSSAGDRLILVTPGDDYLLHVLASLPDIPPSTQPGDPRPVRSCPLILGNFSSNTIYELDPSQTYFINTSVSVPNNVEIRSRDPLRRARIKIKAAYKAYNGLVARGTSGVVGRGLWFYTDSTTSVREQNSATPFTFANGGSGSVFNCYADNTDKFVDLQAGCHDVLISGCETTDKILGQGVWVGGTNITIEDCRLRSRVEHPIRIMYDNRPGWDAKNILIRSCDLLQKQNAVKECLSIRAGSGPIVVESCNLKVGELGQQVAVGYGLRMGHKIGEDPHYPSNVTFKDDVLTNGWCDVKETCRGHGPYVFSGFRFQGDLNTTPPLQLHGTQATILNCTSTSGVVVKP